MIMTCDEKGCENEVTRENSYVPALSKIATAAGKRIADLTIDDLLVFAHCDGCVALHAMVGDDISGLFPIEVSLAEIARTKQQKVDRAKQLELQAQLRKDLAIRRVAKSPLGAQLLALGLEPTVSEFVRV
jgi:hypothetical protein